MAKPKVTIVSGKRKTSVAKVRIMPEGNEITYNNRDYNELPLFHKLSLMEPLRIYESIINKPLGHSLKITAKGGGKESQIQAVRLAIAKALLVITKSKELELAFLAYDRNLLVPDFRRKEAYKPGDSKARAKRQKSYR